MTITNTSIVYAIAFFCIVIGLLWGRFKALHVFGAVILALVLSSQMGIKHIYSAAVNPSILTVMALISLTGVLKKQIRLDRIMTYLGKTESVFLLAISTFTALLSGFVNNTPVVALLIPILKDHSKTKQWNVRLFLLPISFAAVAGGTITLIGTSTNLVLNGMMIENGFEGFQFFDFVLPGTLVTLGVLGLVLPLSKVFLNTSIASSGLDDQMKRQYTTELKVRGTGSMVGKTVEEAKLRSLNDLYLAEIYRNGELVTPVSPQEILLADDTLLFTGAIEHVNELLDQFSNDLTTVEKKFNVQGRSNLIEVLVPNNSDLIGRPLKETNFRSRYDAVIIGVQRGGKPVNGKIGRMILNAGDLLLLSTGTRFFDRNEEETTLIPIGSHERVAVGKLGRERFFLPSLALIILCALVFKLTLLLTVAMMIISAIACGLTHAEKLKHEFNIQLYALLILSVAFGSAVLEGGHAAYFIEQWNLPESQNTAIIGLFFLTVLLTNFMTNVSAVAIAFPVAAAIMTHYGLSSKEVFLPLAFGASASFLTPTSYQTHLMVMGPGNYSNRDFLKLGLPVLFIYSSIALWILLWV